MMGNGIRVQNKDIEAKEYITSYFILYLTFDLSSLLSLRYFAAPDNIMRENIHNLGNRLTADFYQSS